MGEKASTSVTIFSDYLCPWCYVSLVRLRRLKEEYGTKLSFTWKSFPLRPHEMPVSPQRLKHGLAAVSAAEQSIHFEPWTESRHIPGTSMPALEAAKCAQLEGEEAFESYHLLLFRSYFEHGKDISERNVLYDLAKESGLDMSQFDINFSSGKQREKVWADYDEARYQYQVTAIPTAIFENGSRFECAVPPEVYRRAVELSLQSDR